MNIASLLASLKDLQRPAIIFSGAGRSVITFQELDDLSSRLAAGMEADGLRAGGRVIVLAPVSMMLYASLIAVFKLGATAVFLDPQTGYRQLNRAIQLADARAFIASRRTIWLGALLPALRRIPLKFAAEGGGTRSLQHMARAFKPRTGIADVSEDVPALITFTGGSTDSSPRGVLRTHRLLIEQHLALSRVLPIHAGDIDLPAFPVVILHNLASGIPSVIPEFPFRRPDAVQPGKIIRQIRTHGITTASGSPAYWRIIARHCLYSEQTLGLRRIVTGGAPMVPDLMRELRRIAPNAEILNVYGSSEAEPVAVLPFDELSEERKRRIEAGAGVPLGRPVAGICVRILDESYREQAAHQVGEIWVSGGHVARAYFSIPDADAVNKLLDAGGQLWHRMGDLGYMDETGCLWMVGRVDTVIVREGKPIYPVPVETVAGILPFIQRAALVGVADKMLGERAMLVVELSKDAALPHGWRTQLQSLFAERGWAVDEIRPIRKLPVDARHNARIDYRVLRDG